MSSADDAAVTLYRAVGLDEADDILAFSGFRNGPVSAFVEGKWFAASFDDAVRWGQAMPPISRPHAFRIASVTVTANVLVLFDGAARLDGIGPAYFVRHDRLPLLNAAVPIVLSDIFSRSSDDAEQR